MIHELSPRMERATRGYGEMAIARAPADIRAKINQRRAQMGLEPVISVAALARIDARLLQAERELVAREQLAAKPTTSRPAPARRTPPASGIVNVHKVERKVTRVLFALNVGLGDIEPVRGARKEWTLRDAFGSAASLNTGRAWHLVDDGHQGRAIEWVGERLRAIDSDDVPLLVEWLPNLALPAHRQAVDRLAAGAGVSTMLIPFGPDRIANLTTPTRVLARSGLVHIAILRRNERAAYPGACAMIFRDKPDTLAERARQVKAITTESRRRSFSR